MDGALAERLKSLRSQYAETAPQPVSGARREILVSPSQGAEPAFEHLERFVVGEGRDLFRYIWPTAGKRKRVTRGRHRASVNNPFVLGVGVKNGLTSEEEKLGGAAV